MAHCRKCNSHTAHEISLYKKGKDRLLAAGSRRHERDKRGYGGQKYPMLRRKAKTTKKQTLKIRCKKCGYTFEESSIDCPRCGEPQEDFLT